MRRHVPDALHALLVTAKPGWFDSNVRLANAWKSATLNFRRHLTAKVKVTLSTLAKMSKV